MNEPLRQVGTPCPDCGSRYRRAGLCNICGLAIPEDAAAGQTPRTGIRPGPVAHHKKRTAGAPWLYQ